jgi:hypothetical protein
MEALTAWPEKYYRRKTNSSRRMPRRSEVRLRPSSASSEGENENVEVSKQGEESANEKPNHERDLERGAKRKNGSPSIKCEAAEQSVTPIGKTLRLRDRIHLKYVSDQPCMACGRSPSDAHHLRFAQGRALGRKVSDEFTVPLCRTHHRELHLLAHLFCDPDRLCPRRALRLRHLFAAGFCL